MLVGVNLLTFDIGEIEGDFFVKFKLRNKEVQLCTKETLPILIGGDFNIIRCPGEKNNGNYNEKWPFLFNAVIDAVPTFEKLDTVLSCTDWELKFPHTYVHALYREISDHTPLLLNTGQRSNINNTPFCSNLN
ncbi:hypothetical protein U9M48_000598 [Paspalum notatum var. saurae]|uniref:Endonuclease/exonuclease/phosphatase domain-containing protein n=1 Tax=Paspalum notatum var. saurae TaxID=547442 RepID=A0AAQ3PLU5_PASNO